MRRNAFIIKDIVLRHIDRFQKLCAEPFHRFIGRGVVEIAGIDQMIHAVIPRDRFQHAAGVAGVMMSLIRFSDLISDVAVIVGMVIVTDAQTDAADVLAG